MTQFNLLPDIKMEYLIAERDRRLVTEISIFITIVAIILTAFIYTLTVIQKKQIDSLTSNITLLGKNIGSQKNLSDILTIQNQVNTLTSLHQQDPEVSNLFTYLDQLIPVTANISNLNVDFSTNSMILSGQADSLATINKLVDSLKFAKYSIQGSAGSKNAFSSVVLTSFGLSSSGDSYAINLNFDPTLFNNTDKVSLKVPSLVTTRSNLDQPIVLFKPNTNVATK